MNEEVSGFGGKKHKNAFVTKNVASYCCFLLVFLLLLASIPDSKLMFVLS
jgi:hypothetical protein